VGLRAERRPRGNWLSETIGPWDRRQRSCLGDSQGPFNLCRYAKRDLHFALRIIIGMSARRKANPQKSATTYPQRTTAFAEYRRRTGEWPVLSIALYAGRLLLMLAGISFLFWYGRIHSTTFTRTTLYFLLATLPVALGWSVAESLAWNHDLRRKGLLSGQMIMGVRQMPPE